MKRVIVGIKPKQFDPGKKSKPASAAEKTEFFKDLVSVYFSFYEQQFGIKPSFDGSAPRDLKCIIDTIRKRCEENKIVWELDCARDVLTKFLQVGATDSWLKDNFFLFNLNRQKDKIFLKIKNQLNGKSKPSTAAFTREGVADEISRRYQRKE